MSLQTRLAAALCFSYLPQICGGQISERNLLINRLSALFDAISMCIQCGANTQLLHVFQEDFILGYKPQKEPEAHTPAFPPGEGTAQCWIKTLNR